MSEEERAFEKAMHGLECLAEVWAQTVNIDEIVENISGKDELVKSMILQAYIEGMYRGRSSTIHAPSNSKGEA